MQSGNFQQISSDYYTCEQQDFNSGRKLSSLKKVEEFTEIQSESKKELKQLKKRVRFSDQYSPQSLGMAECDEFFEARENLSEISQKFHDTDIDESTYDNSVNQDNKINVEKENKVSLEEKNIYLQKEKSHLDSDMNSENISLIINNVCLHDNVCLIKNNDTCSKENVSLQRNVCSTKKGYVKENCCSSKNVQKNVCLEDNVCSMEHVCLRENVCLKKHVYLKNNVCLKKNICLKENVCLEEDILRENRIYENDNRAEDKSSFDESNIYAQEDETSDDDKENELQNERSKSSNSNSSVTSSRGSQQEESSRILMMLVVDNASRFSRSDLVPLIDSGLKKLEETTSMSTVYNSISTHASSSSSSHEGTNSQLRRRSATSVNSYFSITSTECFAHENDTISNSDKESTTTYENDGESTKSDGILSAMARVVRNALKKFPGRWFLYLICCGTHDSNEKFTYERI